MYAVLHSASPGTEKKDTVRIKRGFKKSALECNKLELRIHSSPFGEKQRLNLKVEQIFSPA